VILLDTNVISELMRAVPNPRVNAFVHVRPLEDVAIAAISEAEIRYGIARMPVGRRRDELAAAFTAFLDQGFRQRILSFDSACAIGYSTVRFRRESMGRPAQTLDALIAGTALGHDADVATRNVTDFADCGIVVINPWDRS